MTHNTVATIEEYIQAKCKTVEACLDGLITDANTSYRTLLHAARYSLMAGGKRLRPILAIAAAEAFGCPEEKVIRPACALELVHTYSLIHDDLPCMDDDDLRRGKPTLHKVVSEAHAVLAGDFLLTFAFEVIADDPHLSESQKLKLISRLAKNAGAEGMIGGQVMDIEAEGKSIDLDTMRAIHRAKTGAIISASVEFGGIIAGVDEAILESLKAYGYEIGLAFQIIDDILDVTGTSESLGKTAASDIANNKATYVTLMGLNQAKAEANECVRRAKELVARLPLQNGSLQEIADLIVTRKR